MSDSKVTVNKVVGLEKGAFIDGAFDKAQFQSAYGICVLPNGNLVVVDRAAHRIRLVDFINKAVKTLAGCGEAGFGDGAGDKAKFNKPYAVVCDADGNLYVSDPENQRIRRIDAKTNAVTTAAGTGKMGFDDGAADKSTFYRPSGMALRDGNLYVADAINARIRCIDLKSNTVSTVIGSGRTGHKDSSLRESEFSHPAGLAFEASGTLLIADQGNHRIRRADFKENKVTTVAGTGEQKTTDGDGLQAAFQFPALILAASNGSTIIGEWGKGAALRVMDGKTAVTTVKGVKDYRGLALNSQGQLFASTDTHIVRIDGLL